MRRSKQCGAANNAAQQTMRRSKQCGAANNAAQQTMRRSKQCGAANNAAQQTIMNSIAVYYKKRGQYSVVFFKLGAIFLGLVTIVFIHLLPQSKEINGDDEK